MASRPGVDYQHRKLLGQNHFWYLLHILVLIRVLNSLQLPGTAADFAKHRYEWRRSYFIGLVCLTFIVSQVVLYNVSSVHTLWLPSALLGLGYGGMYGLFPTIIIEWFGLGQ
jgi:MFS family permease